jgi:cytoskeletal protein RodZ
MDIGGDLRRARTARHLSLAEISDRTKINRSFLQAIEDNRFDRVPHGLFARGFLRAYAREVGLDAEVLVDGYREEFEAPPRVELPSEDAAELVDAANGDDDTRQRQAVGLAVVLLITAVYLGVAHRVVPASSEQLPRATDSVETATPAAVPVSTAGTASVSRPKPLQLTVQTTGDCWVAVNVDGGRVLARLMKAGERERFEVRDEAALRVGDPSAFSFTLDGMPGKALGSAGTPANLKFTQHNYKTVLRDH